MHVFFIDVFPPVELLGISEMRFVGWGEEIQSGGPFGRIIK